MEKRKQWHYLFDIIRYSLSGGTCPEIEETPDWDDLYGICKRHKIESMVSNGLDRMPKEQQPPEEIRQKFRKKVNADTVREAVQFFSLEELLEEFEDQGVDCMPLKGALLKQFYEKPALRTMADLDILYRPEQKEKVDRILLDLGYEYGIKDEHDDGYIRKPHMNIEMHHCLVAAGNRFSFYYQNVWERVRLQEGKKHIYEFSWEDFYIYMLVHLAKHFQNTGSGIRSVVDIWIFLKHMTDKMDWEYLGQELETIGLKDFDAHMRKLVRIWFEGAETDDFYENLSAYVVDCGIWGVAEYGRVQNVLRKNGDRDAVAVGLFRFRLERIFPPIKLIKREYPYLEKHPVLYPAAWVHRVFRTIKKKRTSKFLHTMTMDQTEVLEKRELFRTLGL